MNCRDIQLDIALHGDRRDDLAPHIADHLAICPVCREKLDATQGLINDLKGLSRPRLDRRFERALQYKVRSEIRSGTVRVGWLASDTGVWLQHRVFPYVAGVSATLLVAFVVLTSLVADFRYNMEQAAIEVEESRIAGVMVANSRSSGIYDADAPLPAFEYALLRRDVSAESPSLNPQGALVNISGSLAKRAATKEDGVVVVADVLSNGIARIQEVVDSDRNRRVLNDLEKAFEAELGGAPFVPARLDNRSENVRLVLRFDNVDVRAR